MSQPPRVIVAAAIQFEGVVYSVPCPGRHDAVIHLMTTTYGLPTPIRGKQGFLTHDGKFVDRFEAADLALAAKQIPKLNWNSELYSEDVWDKHGNTPTYKPEDIV